MEATLTQRATLLERALPGKFRLTVTGIAGEFTTIPFQLKRRGGLLVSEFFEAAEVQLGLFGTLPFAEILAKTPEGVARLDIIYEVRTGKDA